MDELTTKQLDMVSQVNTYWIHLTDSHSIRTTLCKVSQIHKYVSAQSVRYKELADIIVSYETKYYSEYKSIPSYNADDILRDCNFYKQMQMDRCNKRREMAFCSYQALSEVRDNITQKIIEYVRLKKQCESVLAEIAHKL